MINVLLKLSVPVYAVVIPIYKTFMLGDISTIVEKGMIMKFMKHKKLWYLGSILIILISFAINFGNDLQRKVLHEKSVYTTKKLPYVTYDK